MATHGDTGYTNNPILLVRLGEKPFHEHPQYAAPRPSISPGFDSSTASCTHWLVCLKFTAESGSHKDDPHTCEDAQQENQK